MVEIIGTLYEMEGVAKVIEWNDKEWEASKGNWKDNQR